MLSHVTLGVTNIDGARRFYDPVTATVGYVCKMISEGVVGYGPKDDERIFLFVCLPYDGKPASAGNGTHIAIMAPDRAAVDAFHEASLANGGRDEGPPGLRPHYHSNYYGAYVRDPFGNKLQACFQEPV